LAKLLIIWEISVERDTPLVANHLKQLRAPGKAAVNAFLDIPPMGTRSNGAILAGMGGAISQNQVTANEGGSVQSASPEASAPVRASRNK
jgi:hypothetical protein